MPPLEEQTTRVIVADVHGDHACLRQLLLEAGAIDSRGQRNEGFFVLQLGDIAHLGHSTYHDDAEAMAMARQWCDVVLCGNHELRFAYGLRAGRFSGMHGQLIPEVRQQLDALRAEGQLVPAWAVDEWLCTHAGVDELYLRQFPAGDVTRCAKAINRRFVGHLTRHHSSYDPLFDSLGQDNHPAGLFWARPHAFYAYSGWAAQIVGHSPRATQQEDDSLYWAPQRLRDNFWVNDVGAALSGKLSALLRQGSQGEWRPLVVSRPQ